jgi:hypothetical protein
MLRIYTIGSYDVPRAKRIKRSKPREQSFSRTKPWEAAGFRCRRTWERHGKPMSQIRGQYASLLLTPGHEFATSLSAQHAEGEGKVGHPRRSIPSSRARPTQYSGADTATEARARSARNGNGKHNDKHRPRHRRTAAKGREAEQDLPMRPDGTVSPEWAARRLQPFDGVLNMRIVGDCVTFRLSRRAA